MPRFARSVPAAVVAALALPATADALPRPGDYRGSLVDARPLTATVSGGGRYVVLRAPLRYRCPSGASVVQPARALHPGRLAISRRGDRFGYQQPGTTLRGRFPSRTRLTGTLEFTRPLQATPTSPVERCTTGRLTFRATRR
jgi:hypothetical protein